MLRIRHALFHGFDRENTLVILENTGGYEKFCIEALNNLGFKVHRANNNRVKHFIKYNGIKAKTDKIDAKSLALYGEVTYNNPQSRHKLTLYKPLSEEQETLRQAALYSQNLKTFRAALKNRFKSPGCDKMQESIKKVLDFITDEVKIIENDMEALMKTADNPDLYKKYELLQKYKGVGKITAMELMTFLPELGELDKKYVVALSGLAPYANDSGTLRGYRSTKGEGRGRPAVRRVLFMATLSSTRYNKELSAYYDKKLNQGKRKMVAMTACMRKMIVHLNAIVKRGEILY